MIGPGIFVISINSAHSNEVLEVNAIIEGNRFIDTVHQKRWNRTDFRIAEDREVVMNLRKEMCRPSEILGSEYEAKYNTYVKEISG